MWIVFVCLGVVLLLFGLGFSLASIMLGIRRQTLEEARAWQEDHYDLSWYDPLEKENYTIRCRDGYELHVQLLRNPAGKDRYIIISHGYTDNRFGALKYAKIYLDQGFHVIVYDLRGHGENEKTFCTYSVRESADLNELILDTRKRYPDAKYLGIHGESLGSATSIACLKYAPPVDFVVSDCGFSEISSILTAGLKQYHLPAFLLKLISLCAKLRYGYRFSQMRPIDSLPGTAVPILFLHGAKDDFILPSHAEAMHQAALDHSELHLIPEAPHAGSVLTDPEGYRAYVTGFLNRVLK